MSSSDNPFVQTTVSTGPETSSKRTAHTVSRSKEPRRTSAHVVRRTPSSSGQGAEPAAAESESADHAERGFVLVESGSDTGRKVPLYEGRTTIGRGLENDIVLTDPAVSKQHLFVERRDNIYFICDLDSGNGTLINRRERKGEILIVDGDKIRIGNTVIAFRGPKTSFSDHSPDSLARAPLDILSGNTISGSTRTGSAAARKLADLGTARKRTQNEEASATTIAGKTSGRADASYVPKKPEISETRDLRDSLPDTRNPLVSSQLPSAYLPSIQVATDAVTPDPIEPPTTMSLKPSMSADEEEQRTEVLVEKSTSPRFPTGQPAAGVPSTPNPNRPRRSSPHVIRSDKRPNKKTSSQPPADRNASKRPLPAPSSVVRSRPPNVSKQPRPRTESHIFPPTVVAKAKAKAKAPPSQQPIHNPPVTPPAVAAPAVAPRVQQTIASSRIAPVSKPPPVMSAALQSTLLDIPPLASNPRATPPVIGPPPRLLQSPAPTQYPQQGAYPQSQQHGAAKQANRSTVLWGTIIVLLLAGGGIAAGIVSTQDDAAPTSPGLVEDSRPANPPQATANTDIGVQVESQELYQQQKFAEAAAILKNAADENPALLDLAASYERIGFQLSVGKTNTEASPVTALAAFKIAFNEDEAQGKSALSKILGAQIVAVAPRAAQSLLAQEQFIKAKKAAEDAIRYGAPAEAVAAVYSSLELKANSLVNEARLVKRADANTAKDMLREASKIAPKGSKAYERVRSELTAF